MLPRDRMTESRNTLSIIKMYKLRPYYGSLLLGLLTLYAFTMETEQQQISIRPANQEATGGNIPELMMHQKVVSQQPARVGMAPHDRASCQLQQASGRRHLQIIPSTERLNEHSPLLDSLSASQTQFNSSQSVSPQQTSQLQLTGISTPSVTSLSSGESGSSGWIGGRQMQRKFDSSERLRQLRQLLVSNSYDAYLVNPHDEHGSEFISDYDRRLKFISGFSGSNGFALILLDKAVLFTDGRYAIQADLELDCNWWLVVSDEPLADIPPWLKVNAPRGLKIATDARLMTLQSYDLIDEQLKKLDSEFALISQDLVDVVWNAASTQGNLERPQAMDPIFIHPLQFAGNITWQEKVFRLADSMNKLRANHYIVSRLEDIAWLLNLRGNDVPISPLFKAFLFVSRSTPTFTSSFTTISGTSQHALGSQTLVEQPEQPEQLIARLGSSSNLFQPQMQQQNQSVRITMYVDLRKIDEHIRNYLHLENGTFFIQHSSYSLDPLQTLSSSPPIITRIQIELKEYDTFIMDLRDKLAVMNGNRQQHGKLLLDVGSNVAIHVLAKAYEDRLVLMESLIMKLKAVKSDSEVQGMRVAHWRDSLAISMLLAQLEVDIGQRALVNKWTEVGAADELELYRSLMDHHKGISFETVSAYGPNAAITHYKPSRDEVRFIGNKSTFLLDTGAQYLDGTTDITRTTHYGEPTDFQRETYTRVLMGAIDQMSLVFEASELRSSYKLNDLAARRYLLELGLDYAHGTGHGIGLYSMCHEPPWLLEHYATGKQAGHLRSGRAGMAQVHSEPVALQANMFTSVEPGYYKANEFGIRLENIVVTQTHQQNPQNLANNSASSRTFLRFEPISLVPFEPKMIKFELLSNKQKSWLNSYNLMIRFRLTQQINYYLGKIRTSQQHQTEPIQVRGTATSSRIYRHLLARQRSSSVQVSNSSASQGSSSRMMTTLSGLDNFLRLEAAQFQEKLERTHRWIMQKTELIPLDVPQSLLERSQGSSSSSSSSSSEQQQQVVSSSEDRKQLNSAERRKRTEDQRLESQRLMLVYMSGSPFYDQDAREALNQMSGRSLEVAPLVVGNSSAASGPGSSNRCSGFQCDLLLASALASTSTSHQYSPNRQLRRTQQQQLLLPLQKAGANWQDHDEQAYDVATSLSDLFQLSASNSSIISLNIWSVCLLIGALVTLQVAILLCMCKLKGGKGSGRGRGSSCQRSGALQVSRSPAGSTLDDTHSVTV